MSEDLYPSRLVTAFRRGTAVPFVGAGLSIGAGLPGFATVAASMANEMSERFSDDTDPLVIAECFEQRFGRNRLLELLREHIDSSVATPTRTHGILMRLQFDTLLTTNYDNLLERALADVGRPSDVVFERAGAALWNERSRVQLLKIHGDLNAPDSIVITSSDYASFHEQHRSIVTLLRFSVQVRTLLFIGYSLRDADFLSVVDRVRLDLTDTRGKDYMRLHYAVTFNMPEALIGFWRRRNIVIINLLGSNPAILLREWLEQLQARIASTS